LIKLTYITEHPFYWSPDDVLISTGNTILAAMKSLLVICNYKALNDLIDRATSKNTISEQHTEVSNQFLLYGIHFVYDEMSRPYSRTYFGGSTTFVIITGSGVS
jgi:hypothetical protein